MLNSCFMASRRRRVLQLALKAETWRARHVETRGPAIRIGGKEVDVFGAELGAAFLGSAELLLVGGDLMIEEAPGVLHVAAVRAGRALDEDVQQRLDHVVRELAGSGCGR